MELRDIRNILKGKKHAVNPLTAVPVEQPTPFAKKSPALEPYVKLKKTLGLRIRDRVDQTSMEAMSEPLLRQEISSVCDHLFDDNPALIDEFERRMLMRDIQNEMAGLGPLDPLLGDPSISGIMVNRYNRIYVERHGRIELTDATFGDDKHLLRIIDRIVSRAGSWINESSPMVRASMQSSRWSRSTVRRCPYVAIRRRCRK
ncbi:MAG: type secretion system protein [Betaproteobacteria bacterium]|nr:type secretion system protein [Betaproteobacteria bacterium]